METSNPGFNRGININGLVVPKLGDLITLVAYAGAGGTDENNGFYKCDVTGNAGGSYYRVTSGKRFVLVGVRAFATTAGKFNLGYSTTDVGGSGSVTSGINMISGSTLNSSNNESLYFPATTDYAIPQFGSVPSLMYPCVRNLGSAVARVTLYGYEV